MPLPGQPPLDASRSREGSLRETPFAVLLDAVAAQKRTVLVELERGPMRKRIVVEDGVPVDCRSNLVHETLGRFLAATDEEILAAYHLVAESEGVFVEPASAASIAGLLKSVEDGWVKPGSTVVCTVTGNGLKDPDTALRDMPTVTPLPVDPGAVVAELGLG